MGYREKLFKHFIVITKDKIRIIPSVSFLLIAVWAMVWLSKIRIFKGWRYGVAT
jgi:hypothetical protein